MLFWSSKLWPANCLWSCAVILRLCRALRHSRLQRPRSFWSAPRIATSGQVQRDSASEWLCKHNRLRPEPIRFVRLEVLECAEWREVRLTSDVGLGQRSRFLVLTERSAASGDGNGLVQNYLLLAQSQWHQASKILNFVKAAVHVNKTCYISLASIYCFMLQNETFSLLQSTQLSEKLPRLKNKHTRKNVPLFTVERKW